MDSIEKSIGEMHEEEQIYFCFSATLRIYGDNLDFELINKTMEIQPTHMHRKGDYNYLGTQKIGSPFENDMWQYDAPIHESNDLDEHIQCLWNKFKQYKEFLIDLKRQYTVDIFCGYRSNCDHAGFEVSPESLKIFMELEIPFGVSIIVC